MKFFRKEEEGPDPVIGELRQKVDTAQLPAAVRGVADREMELLGRIGPATAEFTIGLTYVEYLISMPWEQRTDDLLDIARAEEVLDEDHYGLRPIKERILEHLAVKKLKLHRRPMVLVVDDEEVARRNLQHILSREDYTVVTAANGVEALQRMGTAEFDVILTDFKMEKIDGMEILEKARIRAPRSRVVMITGYATVDSAVEAMKKGAFHYIAKPFKLDEVRDTVRQAINSQSLRKDTAGSVLCFSGPPGTGKTSLGRSIARALGRKAARISLGGIKDEAEIRGHRRTYAGAMPGRIIQELRRCGSANPLLILDEMDKIGGDFKGDPGAALLEVLDPEQNAKFVDHYLDVPFDLSDVIFIVTANIADNIIGPLRDRMEVIQFSGYTEEEKSAIASQYLVPRQVKETGLSQAPPVFTGAAVSKIIQEYTHEAGIRGLNREIASLCRKMAHARVRQEGGAAPVTVDEAVVGQLLGPRRFFFETAEKEDKVGVTVGLVWTEVGGEIIFVEAVTMKGKQQLILTGSLGDVMRESAQAALSYIRSNAARLGIAEDFFGEHDIHIHVPAGAIPKDGPSAGATIALALISLLTGRKARRNVAVTGELTLSGRILPVGGIKEKVLAARRARVRTVIVPTLNKGDIEGLGEAGKGMTIICADRLEDIIDVALAVKEDCASGSA